jgi:hypothetical protein
VVVVPKRRGKLKKDEELARVLEDLFLERGWSVRRLRVAGEPRLYWALDVFPPLSTVTSGGAWISVYEDGVVIDGFDKARVAKLLDEVFGSESKIRRPSLAEQRLASGKTRTLTEALSVEGRARRR